MFATVKEEYITKMSWHLLVLSLPTGNATARMRAWRGLKACGAAVLRDGVYAMPGQDQHLQALRAIAGDVQAHQGLAHVLHVDTAAEELQPLFDRGGDFQALQREAGSLLARLPGDSAQRLRGARQARKRFEQLVKIDFFPTDAQDLALQALLRLEAGVARAASPDEPGAEASARAWVELKRSDHQARLWATRSRPGIDRMACAWLIRRFIDEQARFLWLARPCDCPPDALGYDFDGAAFSHQAAWVSFQVLCLSFGLDRNAALRRMGALVQALDTGGPLPPEAPGVEAVLAGMCIALTDDEQLRLASAGVFEGLLRAFENEAAAGSR